MGVNNANHRTHFKDVSYSQSFVAATDYSTTTPKIVGRPGHTIFIQLIVLSITTATAATQTFQDSSATPVLVAGTAATPVVGAHTWDFGEEGLALPEGAGFNHKMSAAGSAGGVVVQAYMKPTGVLTTVQ